MEIKKSPKADLEGGKTMSVLMGLVIALAVMFVSLEWGTYDIKIATANEGVADIIAEEEIEITRPETPPPPPPPPPPQAAPEILEVVEDDVKLEQKEIMSSEDSQTAAQTQTYVPPAAVEQEEEEENHIFTIVESPPEFPGGEGELLKYLNKMIRYPVIAQENGIQGRVQVSFVVNRDGSIVDAEILRSRDPSLDKEALRVISGMPKWKPGMQRGKPVRVKFSLPVTFRLQ